MMEKNFAGTLSIVVTIHGRFQVSWASGVLANTEERT